MDEILKYGPLIALVAIAWFLEKIKNKVDAIHFMMKDDFDKKNGLGRYGD